MTREIVKPREPIWRVCEATTGQPYGRSGNCSDGGGLRLGRELTSATKNAT